MSDLNRWIPVDTTEPCPECGDTDNRKTRDDGTWLCDSCCHTWNDETKAAIDNASQMMLPTCVANAIRLSHQCRANRGDHVRQDFEAGCGEGLEWT